ncbi:ABC transporter permease [Nonomuraea sp. NBC_01738]|uniref:ABC transporter permease n=1 Tax=Nonomuraea sp. NBC_01738 TaxID=2976003 RepID=UPI002E0E61DA|nr:ABC transporter permease [Nonomuraea sp. NBC_01738]
MTGRWSRAVRSPRGLAGTLLVALLVLAAVFGPMILGISPYEQGDAALAGPSGTHLLGTDEVGRDLLARTLHGIRSDLLICLVAVPLAALLGTGLGLLGGLSRWGGEIMQRIFDVLLGFHGVILGMAIALVISPGFVAVVTAIVLITVPGFGRQARAALLAQLSREYVVAATTVGASRLRVLRRHVLPNVTDSVTALFAVTMANAVKIEGGLSLIGLGIQPPQPSLGTMISAGSRYIQVSPQYALAPVLLLAMLVLGLTLLSDAINRERLRG